ncbi:hypothetical protein MmiHf6_00470 [Methanimicrococcus hongohii]|uniref:Uncharacterized protein n=1 Tax=Methanimicrococcus hongohii TaxID=3028295 RepID=A0AA96ZTL3_9EURY|nr:hypothetical protein [Methanimicrococcus sp. Hf6]WNY22762.1 hypothetical protein MmiHf6_00470 [Methanimicrococcus sp. Hf6]
MATSSLTDIIIVKDKKAIKTLEKIMFSSEPHNDIEVDVFGEMRRCEELF